MRTRFALWMPIALITGAALSAQPMLVVDSGPRTIAQTPSGMSGGGMDRQKPTEAQVAARQFRGPQVQGRRLLKAVTKVTKQLAWHDDLEEAAAEAAESGKPIFWVQALGDLKGYT